MSLFTRARKHIDMNRVKELREEKIKEETIAEIQKQQEDILAELKKIEIKESPKYSNWRRELQETITMSTNDIMTATLPARGDVDLVGLDHETPHPLVQPGATNIGGTYTFGPVDLEYGYASTLTFSDTVDLTKVDTLVFDFTAGDITNFDFVVDTPGDSSVYSLSISSGRKVITLRQSDRAKNATLSWTLDKNQGDAVGTNRISGVALQRRTNITTGIRLDDPEINSFIRMGDMSGLSAEERKAKLKDMLDAGNEYLTKYTNVTPSQTAPGDIELANVTSDARNPMGTGDQAAAPAALLASPIVQAAAAKGIAALAALVGSMGTAKQIMNQINRTSDPYGADLPGATTTGSNPRARNLTPQQQAEVEAAGNELRDARRALEDLPADATDAQKDMAQERLDRATKNRQRVRNKHKQENKNRKD